jgi:hypothetical protein
MTTIAVREETQAIDADENDSEGVCNGAQGTNRVCVMCGTDLRAHRSDATTCGGACRAERSRLLGILSGKSSGPYYSIAQRLKANAKRTQSLLDVFPEHQHHRSSRRLS